MSNSRKIYISGPMTGYKDFNYTAFFAAEVQLRKMGYKTVENPAKNPPQKSWEEYMKVALAQMLKCDVIVLLEGWEHSRGASEEVRIAKMLALEVLTLESVIGECHEPGRI